MNIDEIQKESNLASRDQEPLKWKTLSQNIILEVGKCKTV